MTDTPEFDDFKAELRKLKTHKLFRQLLARGEIQLGKLALADVFALMLEDAARYFLLAAANLNRTQLKNATKDPETAIVEKKLRQAHVVRKRLPLKVPFDEVVARAESLRKADLGRKDRRGIEALFRERLAAEKIPVLMAPPIRPVPGILVSRRKPDGVWPDPSQNLPPVIYLEIKNVRRVVDDIQKRLYEIAEASLEMKLLYGNFNLQGLGLSSTSIVLEQSDEIRAKLRKQIVSARPAVVALFLCPKNEAERYRAGAEAFIDRLFFQEEIEECLAFLRSVAKSPLVGTDDERHPTPATKPPGVARAGPSRRHSHLHRSCPCPWRGPTGIEGAAVELAARLCSRYRWRWAVPGCRQRPRRARRLEYLQGWPGNVHGGRRRTTAGRERSRRRFTREREGARRVAVGRGKLYATIDYETVPTSSAPFRPLARPPVSSTAARRQRGRTLRWHAGTRPGTPPRIPPRRGRIDRSRPQPRWARW